MKRRYIESREKNSRRQEPQDSKSREILPARDLRTSLVTADYRVHDDWNGQESLRVLKFRIWTRVNCSPLTNRNMFSDPWLGLKKEFYDVISEQGDVGFSELDKGKLEKTFSRLDKKVSDRALTEFRWKRINLLLFFTFGGVFVLFSWYIFV